MKESFVLLLCLVNCVFCSELGKYSSSPCVDHNHILLVPGVLSSGGVSRACLSRFFTEGPAQLTVTLVTELQSVVANKDLSAGDGGCIEISVPQLPNTKAELIASVSYPSRCTWKRRLNLRIGSARLALVHTERARYRPGDALRLRAMVLKADLTPSHGVIDELWLEAPGALGSRAAQWQQVRTRLGLAQVQFPLEAQAPSGKWTVRMRLADGTQSSTSFLVGNYELPPFQLSVKHSAKVLRTAERLVWTVCVRYPWTEAVEGMLVIRLRGAGGRTITPDVRTDGRADGVRTAVRLRAPRACHRHAAAAKRVGIDGNNPPDVVVADFSFQEDGTRVWQNTTVVSQVVDKAISLEFLNRYRAMISPGLPYKLKLKAIRWDDKPASNQRVTICRSPSPTAVETPSSSSSSLPSPTCEDVDTDSQGVARLVFMVEDMMPFYKIQAHLTTDNTTVAPDLYLPVQRFGSTHATLGSIRGDPKSPRSLVPLYLKLDRTNAPVTVHYVVITRGGIIYRWGATTQCPLITTTNQIYTTSKHSFCNDDLHKNEYHFDEDTNNNYTDKTFDKIPRIILPIKVTHQMCPESHMVAYFYHKGEMVSASKVFEMDDCFSNKAQIGWQSFHVAPGSLVNLRINTPGPAICALTALDTASKWVEPQASVKTLVMTGLRRLMDAHRNLTEYDAAGECFLTMDTPELPSSSTELTETWLSTSGIRLAGETRARSCRAPPARLTEETVPRKHFSESWLWRVVVVGSNGSASVTARSPDSVTRYDAEALCLSRSGIAVSQPSNVQVFREFFIHADCPKRLRQGDTTVVRYRIFNYLYEPLSVQIQTLTDPHLHGPADLVQAVCISPRSSVARRLELRAALPGHAKLSVRAKSVTDGFCGNSTANVGVSDEVIIKLLVEPEGVPMQDHRSMLLCGRDGDNFSPSQVTWTWLAVQAVPGTEAATVWAASDVTGPLLADADALVQLPRGCGEQNLARLATNLLALDQLHPTSPGADVAKEHVARGLTRQLQYAHPSGGFSAFGPSDPTPSTWLTAFAVRYLRKAYQKLSPHQAIPQAVERAEHWLINQQMENGCFRNDGQVFHRELKGGMNEDGETASVALTAYVITSLIENPISLPLKALSNSLSCLRALPPLKTISPTRIYAQALIAYAFMRIKRYEEELAKKNEASPMKKTLERDEEMRELVNLQQMARRSRDFVWWETDSLSTSIEATGYALLALAECPPSLKEVCSYDASAAVRWLNTHRNAAGGFVATQDTLIALEGILRWSSQLPSAKNLTVTVNNGRTVMSVTVNGRSKVPDVINVDFDEPLHISVEGSGCTLVQATRVYNTLATPDGDQRLSLQTSVLTEGTFDCDANKTSCYCAAVVEVCMVWTSAFPEMVLLEASFPGGFGPDASLLYAQLGSNKLIRRIELTPSGSRATVYLGARSGQELAAGHRCVNFNVVGPATRTKPAFVRIMDYYNPRVNDTQMYTIPEDCPSSLSPEDKYSSYDNLFNKGKSLENDGEVILTHEFSFDDLPENPNESGYDYENFEEKTLHTEATTHVDENTENLPDNVTQIENTDQPIPINATNEVVVNSKTEVDNEITKTDTIIGPINNFVSQPHNIAVRDDTESKIRFEHDVQHIEAKSENIKALENTKPRTEDVKEAVANPNLSTFHVINTDKDLEVPSGIEGPVPAIVLPPPNFVAREFNSRPAAEFKKSAPFLAPRTYIDPRSYVESYYRPRPYIQTRPYTAAYEDPYYRSYFRPGYV